MNSSSRIYREASCSMNHIIAVTCWMTPQKMPPRNIPDAAEPPMVVAMMIGISENPTEGEVGK